MRSREGNDAGRRIVLLAVAAPVLDEDAAVAAAHDEIRGSDVVGGGPDEARGAVELRRVR